LVSQQIRDSRNIIDPTCGIGDLLLSCARQFAIGRNLNRTVNDWSQRLIGLDNHQEFIDAARRRLILLAYQRGKFAQKEKLDIVKAFPGLKQGDMLARPDLIEQADCILFNPPFAYMESPSQTKWSSGRVSSAAVFLDVVVQNSKPGAWIAAILPEVLRGGTRYEEWRKLIRSRVKISYVESVGLFDPWTDVDVFLFVGEVGSPTSCNDTFSANSITQSQSISGRVEDSFKVRVGPVVPHRHKHKGPWRAYVEPLDLPRWGILRNIKRKRRFSGTTYRTPFVAIRRTSRPDDEHRAVATIVSGQSDVAVENHLIVAVPNDGKVATCRMLVEVLKRQSTNDFLNKTIRCRHLTVDSIRNILWTCK
jgi:hypothetical protein